VGGGTLGIIMTGVQVGSGVSSLGGSAGLVAGVGVAFASAVGAGVALAMVAWAAGWLFWERLLKKRVNPRPRTRSIV
jgi:hypothetical protein